MPRTEAIPFPVPAQGLHVGDPYAPILGAWRRWDDRLTRAELGKRTGFDPEYLEPILRKLRKMGWVQVHHSKPQTFGIDNDPFP